MKIFKFAVITLIVVAASSFSNADAQIVIKEKIGSGHVYHRPHRPVHHVHHRHYHHPVYYRHR